jgi:hypothetical protein
MKLEQMLAIHERKVKELIRLFYCSIRILKTALGTGTTKYQISNIGDSSLQLLVGVDKWTVGSISHVLFYRA